MRVEKERNKGKEKKRRGREGMRVEERGEGGRRGQERGQRSFEMLFLDHCRTHNIQDLTAENTPVRGKNYFLLRE